MIYPNKILIINNDSKIFSKNLSIIKPENLNLENIKKYNWFFIFFDSGWCSDNFRLNERLLKIKETKKIYINQFFKGPAFWVVSREDLKNMFLLFQEEYFNVLKESFSNIIIDSYETFPLVKYIPFVDLKYKPTIDNLKNSINLYVPKFSTENLKILNYLNILTDASDEVIDYAFDIIEDYIDFSLLNKAEDFTIVGNYNITEKFFNRFGFYISYA